MKPYRENLASLRIFVIAVILILWDPISYPKLKSISINTQISRISTAEFSPDGKLFVTSSDDYPTEIWETSSGKILFSLKGYFSYSTFAHFSNDSKFLITTSVSMIPTVQIWEIPSGRLIFSLDGHSDLINSGMFSPDGRLVITSSSDKTIKVWETDSGKLIYSLDCTESLIGSVGISPDGKWLAAGLSVSNNFFFIIKTEHI